MDTHVQIDGSFGEGGGQIIRTSLSLSAITGKPVEVVNVRHRRLKPGLQPQHLTAVRAAAALCCASLEGDAVGSTRFLFAPQSPTQAGCYHFDIRTAGAASLVMQTLLLPLARVEGESQVTVLGGTHVPHAPTADYLEGVYLPTLRMAGLASDFQYSTAGFFPKGGGEEHLQIPGTVELKPLDLTSRGKLVSLRSTAVTSNLPVHVGERGAAAVEGFMKTIGRTIEVIRQDRPSIGAGASVFVLAECEGGRAGFSALGERGKPMERVAEDACRAFLDWWKSGAACDEHLSDQLVLPLALATGESRWTTPVLTDHLRTVLHVTGQFLPLHYTLAEQEEGGALVTLAPGL